MELKRPMDHTPLEGFFMRDSQEFQISRSKVWVVPESPLPREDTKAFPACSAPNGDHSGE